MNKANPKKAPAASGPLWMQYWLLRLCELDSTSGREDALLPSLHQLLQEMGAEVYEQPVAQGRTNVLALWGRPRVLFSTHLDTVPPFIPPRKQVNAIYGRGTCDAKGQIMAQLEAIRQMLREGITGFAWLGVVGEETDSIGAAAALGLSDRVRDCRALINGEPTDLKLATGQRGVSHLRLVCKGKAAHSGSPELGLDANWMLIDWLQRVRELPRPQDPDLGPEVWNLGRLEGGQAINSVSDHAEAHVLVRTLPHSIFALQAGDLKPENGDIEVLLSEPADRYPALPGFDHAPMPFGSDVPRLRELIPDRTAVLAGPGSISLAHAENEHITLAALALGVDLNKRLAVHFLKD
ncbi:MAG: M20/M25/M40 family metallo-hydrolase [Holophagaceae bacterium]|nr:M20/M25/M40 family metallo-hydrolase [Holophagaceae bacterium]